MSAREEILKSIRTRLGRGPLQSAVRRELERSMENTRPDLLPAKAQEANKVGAFVERASKEAVTVDRLAVLENVPAAVFHYLRAHGLPRRIVSAPDPVLEGLPWKETEGLELSGGPLSEDGQAVLTRCFAGVAEGGVTVTVSSQQHPVEFNFLAATQIVILEAGQLLGAYDEIWARLRQAGTLPRAVNMLLGPSRSADIEQTLELGAHGPLRLHVLLIGG